MCWSESQVRQHLVRIEGYMKANKYSLFRRVAKSVKGESAGRIDLMAKLIRTDINHLVSKLSLELIGDDGLIAPRTGQEMAAYDPEGPTDNSGWLASYMGSLGGAIAAGSSNIQRNIIGERGLGLPRDWAASQHK